MKKKDGSPFGIEDLYPDLATPEAPPDPDEEARRTLAVFQAMQLQQQARMRRNA